MESHLIDKLGSRRPGGINEKLFFLKSSLCSPFLKFFLFHFGNAFYKFSLSGLTDCIFVLVEDRQPHYLIHRGRLTDICNFHVPTSARVSV